MKEKKTSEFVGAIIGNIFGIIFTNSVLLWYPLTGGIILETWVDTLWAANLSMVVQILGNLLLATYRPARLYSFLQFIFSGVNLMSLIVFFLVFPLDFSHLVADWLNKLVRIAMMIGMIVTLIGGVAHLVRFIFGTEYKTTDAGAQADITKKF